jgi:hypothetical protein
MADALGLDLSPEGLDPRLVKYLKSIQAPEAPASAEPSTPEAPGLDLSADFDKAQVPGADLSAEFDRAPAQVPGDPTIAAAQTLKPAAVRGPQFQSPELGDEALEAAQKQDRRTNLLFGGSPSAQSIMLNRVGIAAPMGPQDVGADQEARVMRRRAAGEQELKYGGQAREEEQKDLTRRAAINAYMAMQRDPSVHEAAVRQVAQAEALAANNGIPPTAEQMSASMSRWSQAPTLVLAQTLGQLEASSKNAAETAQKSAEGMKGRQEAVRSAQLTPYDARVKETEAVKNMADAAKANMEAATGPAKAYWETVKTSAESWLAAQGTGAPSVPPIPERLGASASSAAPSGFQGAPGATVNPPGFVDVGEGQHQVPDASRVKGSPPLPPEEEQRYRHGSAARANIHRIETSERPDEMIRLMGLPEAAAGLGVKVPWLGNVSVPATQLYERLKAINEAELAQMREYFNRTNPGEKGEVESQAYASKMRLPALKDLFDAQHREEFIRQRDMASRRFHETVDRSGQGRYESHIRMPATREEFQALKPGTRYLNPSGASRIKE